MADVRQQSRKLLTSQLAQQGDESQAQAVAEQIEEQVCNAHGGDTGNEYRNQMRSLSLDVGKNNIQLAQQLMSGELSARDLLGMGSEGLKSDERAQQDNELREQALRESRGTQKIPVAESGGPAAGPAAASNLADDGEVGAQEAMMGEEGDFKQRTQPKIAGLEGIEFESGL